MNREIGLLYRGACYQFSHKEFCSEAFYLKRFGVVVVQNGSDVVADTVAVAGAVPLDSTIQATVVAVETVVIEATADERHICIVYRRL